MKRFYCIECKKVKRVQKWPIAMLHPASNVEINPKIGLALNPNERIGKCNRHLESERTR